MIEDFLPVRHTKYVEHYGHIHQEQLSSNMFLCRVIWILLFLWFIVANFTDRSFATEIIAGFCRAPSRIGASFLDYIVFVFFLTYMSSQLNVQICYFSNCIGYIYVTQTTYYYSSSFASRINNVAVPQSIG